MAVAGASSNIAPLPFTHVGDMTVEKLESRLKDISGHAVGGWWLRVADKLFSPALDSTGEVDPEISHYWIVFGKSLPNPYNNMVAASDERFGGVNIVHSQRGEPVISDAAISRPVPVHNTLRLFVDVRQQQHSVERSLEKNLEEEEEDEELVHAVDSVTNESYFDEVVKITSIGSGDAVQRNFKSDGHTTAEKYIGCRMKKAKLAVQYIPFKADSSTGMNVMGCIPGQDNKFLILGAHYDTLPTPPEKSPGAMDNGSGVGVMMSSMEALSKMQFQHSVCFTAFDGEELGLLGSKHIAKEIKTKMAGNFLGAVTSDMSTGFKSTAASSRPSGYDDQNSVYLAGTHDPAVDGIHIDGNPASKNLISKVSDAALKSVKDHDLPILSSEASIWNSDQKAFHASGLPAIDICAANHRVYQFWHHDHNTTDNLDPKIGAEISRTAIAATYKIAGHVGSRDMEEQPPKAVLPRFTGAKSLEQLFPDTDCEAVLHEHHAEVAKQQAAGPHNLKKSTSSAGSHKHDHDHEEQPQKQHKQHVASHMSLELAKELEESLSSLEKALAKKD